MTSDWLTSTRTPKKPFTENSVGPVLNMAHVCAEVLAAASAKGTGFGFVSS